jgi:hypothetical protein
LAAHVQVNEKMGYLLTSFVCRSSLPTPPYRMMSMESKVVQQELSFCRL